MKKTIFQTVRDLRDQLDVLQGAESALAARTFGNEAVTEIYDEVAGHARGELLTMIERVHSITKDFDLRVRLLEEGDLVCRALCRSDKK